MILITTNIICWVPPCPRPWESAPSFLFFYSLLSLVGCRVPSPIPRPWESTPLIPLILYFFVHSFIGWVVGNTHATQPTPEVSFIGWTVTHLSTNILWVLPHFILLSFFSSIEIAERAVPYDTFCIEFLFFLFTCNRVFYTKNDLCVQKILLTISFNHTS